MSENKEYKDIIRIGCMTETLLMDTPEIVSTELYSSCDLYTKKEDGYVINEEMNAITLDGKYIANLSVQSNLFDNNIHEVNIIFKEPLICRIVKIKGKKEIICTKTS